MQQLGARRTSRTKRTAIAATATFALVLLAMSTPISLGGPATDRRQAVAAPSPSPTAQSLTEPICRTEDHHATAATATPAAVSRASAGVLCASDDARWSSVFLQAGFTYTVETDQLAEGGDSVLTLYSPDGRTALASDDNGGAQPGASLLHVTVATSGVYYLAVSRGYGMSRTATLRYDLRVF